MRAHYIVARKLTAHAQWKQNTNTAESIFRVGEENWLCSQGTTNNAVTNEASNEACAMYV